MIEQPSLVGLHKFVDSRGWFLELYNTAKAQQLHLSECKLVNVNVAGPNVLKGMHFQHPHNMAKLVTCIHGSVLDVVVDVRVDSPTFGHHFEYELSLGPGLYVPRGFAHGFYVRGDEKAVLLYATDQPYDPACDRSLLWCDPQVGIEWPVANPVLSDKDRFAPTLARLQQQGLLPTLATVTT